MISIDFEALENKSQYKLLIGSVVPRPIAFVTSVSENHVLNGAPFSYFGVVSSEPPLLSVSIRKEGVEPKDTLRNILSKKQFVIHIVSKNYLNQVNQSSFSYPKEVSEIEATKLTKVKSQKIDVDGVKEAKIRFECILEQAIDLPGSVLVIGRVVYAHFDEDVYQNGKINIDLLQPISRLAGNKYGTIGEIIELDKPTK
ncbi:MAG: hypothetical protein CVV56_01390 [Tenericutes bacterium HGW-Tenericutes-1]|jgi:flavin reductase (DIM6/NTAB) family NADH-FMN oxidoreductase RutF|nr:MAG: hypothetical protein CVV56_01390 [Tenericutes bacterium HGW-Tenericutes-1]